MIILYLFLTSIFFGICAYLTITAFLERPDEPEGIKKRSDRSLLMKNPSYRLFVRLSRLIISLHPKNRLGSYFLRVKKRLILAGEPLSLLPEEFLTIKELFAAAMLIISLIMGFSLFTALLLCIAGFFYPDLWLRERYKRRRIAVLKELPYILDLLTLSIEAGLDLTGSVSRVVEKSKKSILSLELFHFLQELKMGKPRKEALNDMAKRMNIPEITSLTNAIVQSEELGSGLARTLRIQSQEYRTKRFQRAEKLAMEAPVKMTFPLLFIFVSVFLILFGSFIIQAYRGKLF